jgi:flavin reductase (DIM6/NTAB) family NADH-FMN oxidoreductase RutF
MSNGAAASDKDLAEVLANLTTGIYVLTLSDGGNHHGMSSSWVTQVSGAPVLFMAAIDSAHHSHELVSRAGVFGFNILGVRGRALEDYFGSARAQRANNLEDLDYELSPRLAVPWLRLAMAVIEAKVVQTLVAGDHTLFVAAPIGVRINERERPLTSLDLDYVYLGGKQVVPRDRSGWT